ncbi:MAG: hypothetical protein FWH12_02165 [Treponema sp.]|nr:hypothetical protein [Treponema sp.]
MSNTTIQQKVDLFDSLTEHLLSLDDEEAVSEVLANDFHKNPTLFLDYVGYLTHTYMKESTRNPGRKLVQLLISMIMEGLAQGREMLRQSKEAVSKKKEALCMTP